MEYKTPHIIDIELGPHDIQALNGPDAVAAFFARLGYNTAARTLQTANNLGITAEGTTRPLKRIELVADQEALFQIYLFELTSVTISHTRALGRSFRNRTGNYLLILTSDYEYLDFVLLEKYLSGDQRDAAGIAPKQVSIRPRILTVERHKPSRIHLRVLRRFTWTESDPFAQYDKLLSAYAVADWSEEFFNNRALFSDYYLLERLPTFSAWVEDPKPAFLSVRELYQGASSRFAGKEKNLLQKGLLEGVLKILGYEFKLGNKQGDRAEPDYRLFSIQRLRAPIGLCLTYPWGRSLDGKDDQRDKETSEENPGAVVVSLLEKGEAPWVVVTNGKLWRLYAQQTHSRATNFYEVDLEEVLAQSGPLAADPSESFRYFWILFRFQSFEQKEVEREGRKVLLSLLDQLLLESEDYAKELGERLKGRIFEEIFPHLASGFIASIQKSNGRLNGLSQDELDEVFQGTLTFLYRLLFLLYAEARDLLPAKEVRGYFEASLTKLKREVGDVAGAILDEAEGKLRKHYTDDQFGIYDRLTHLFRMVDKGDSALNIPVYNGGLFISDPAEDDQSQDARVTRFLNTTKVADRYLSQALNHLTRDIDPKRQDLVFIDYKSLGVRQLGSIYEGLLEFKLLIADRKLAIIKEKGREVFVPFNELDEKDKERADRQGRIVRKGQVYLENSKRERKATGSYYTPDHIVKYIVEHAVGPVLQEKFEAMRPKLREAQQKRNAFFQRQEGLRKQRLRPEPESKADLIGRELVDELFNAKVLDPAMGSGHFLVEAVDYITDKTLDFLNAFQWNPVFAHLSRMRETILQESEAQGITIDSKRLTDVNLLKRHILKRCIYGVDLNPMAVELAKVSLWLDCFTLGAPLSFLDHHLRCGNSLIGATVQEVKEAVEPEVKIIAKGKRAASASEWEESETKVSQLTLFSSRFAGLLLATDLMRHVGELSDVTSSQVRESQAEYHKASDALAPFKRILDVYTSQWFGNGISKKQRSGKAAESRALAFLKSRKAEAFINAQREKILKNVLEGLPAEDCHIAETALATAAEKRFFHWELEFPEVFYGPRSGTTQLIERLERAGFDAVIGNPPYDEPSQYYSNTTEADKCFFSEFQSYRPFKNGRLNLYRLFIVRGLEQAKRTGMLSYIVPMTVLADDFSRPTREFILERERLIRVEAFPQKDDPKRRVFFEAKLSTCILVVRNITETGEIVIRTHPGRYIEDSSPAYLTSSDELSHVFKRNIVIPAISKDEWTLLRNAFGRSDWAVLGKIARIYVGEVFDNTPNKKYLSDDPIGPIVLRGANIDRYLLRKEASQGRNRYLKAKLFQKEKQRASKIDFLTKDRIGLQRGAAVDNWRRLIACPIPSGFYCFDTILLIIPERIDHRVLLGLINSDLWEWRFRCTSTTNHVNEYELADLPIPPSLLDENKQEHKELCKLVDSLLKSSEDAVRRSDSQEVPFDSIDYQIDNLVFHVYGVQEEGINVVQKSLSRQK